ncbi:helix-turn-helix domain-containing protein [Chloroflexota bacterium]
MNQTELAQSLGVSKPYISMVLSGKKKPSQRIVEDFRKLGINLVQGNFDRKRADPKSCSSANSDTPPQLRTSDILP